LRRVRPEIITGVLLKAIMALPKTDLQFAKCLIDPAKVRVCIVNSYPSETVQVDRNDYFVDDGLTPVDWTNVRLTLHLGQLLEECQMPKVWQFVREHTALVHDVIGFNEALRYCTAARVWCV
jgi:hypothetical protein